MNSEKMKNEEVITQLVTFRLGKEQFGINIFKVSEINKIVNITKVPNAPEFVEGVINLRGKVIPVLDLRLRLGIVKKEIEKTSRIIVVELNDKVVAFLVDEVMEVLNINQNILEQPPKIIAGINSDFITNIAKLENRLLILLDVDKLLKTEEKEALELVD